MSAETAVTIDTTALKATAEKIAIIATIHRVFGGGGATHVQVMQRDFINSIVDHAVSPGYYGYLELTYTESCVRFIITTLIVNNVAELASITAYDHPWPLNSMDYVALNKAIKV